MRSGQGLAALAFAYYALALAVLPMAVAMAPAPPKPAKKSNPVANENDEEDNEDGEDGEEEYVASELVGTAQTLSPSSSESKLAAWATWLVDSCGVPEKSLASFAMANFKQPSDMVVRGLAASRSLPQGEKVVCIPERCWFHEPVQQEGSAELQECTPHDAMAVDLAQEIAKGADSKYASWFSLLPDETSLRDHHPAFSKDNAHGPTFDHWKSLSDNVTRCAKDRSTKADSKEVSPEGLLLASVLVRTRALDHWGVVPVLDMVNTGRYENVDFILKDIKGLHMCLKTLRPIAKDEELHVSYRAALSHAGLFFTKHGFALDARSHELHGLEWDGCKEDSHTLPEGHNHPALAWFMSFWQKHCVVKPEEPEEPPEEDATEEQEGLDPFERETSPEYKQALEDLKRMNEETERKKGANMKPLDPTDDWDYYDEHEEL